MAENLTTLAEMLRSGSQSDLPLADLDNSWAASQPNQYVGTLEMMDSGNYLRRPDGGLQLHDPATDTVDRATGQVYRRRPVPLNPNASRAAEGVNIFGRALGALGVDDAQGTRRSTPWATAWANTHGGLSLANMLQGATTAADRLLTESSVGRQDPVNTQLGLEIAGTLGTTAAPTAVLGGMPRGAIGTFGSRVQPAGRVATEDVVRFLQDSGVTDIRSPRTGSGRTEYVRFVPPHNSPVVGNRELPVVRVPIDPAQHVGNRPAANQRVGNFFDTGISSERRQGHPDSTVNASGGSYSDPENLLAALRWRTSSSPDGQWLVSPDQAPRTLRPAPDVAPHRFDQWWSTLGRGQRRRHLQAKREAQAAGAAPEPTQPRLLSGAPPGLASFLQGQHSAPPEDPYAR